MRATHPADGVLRAYLDGELDWPRATACTLHLRRCAACAAALDELRRLDERTAALLARADVAARAHESRTRAHWRALRWPAGAGALAAAGLLLVHAVRAPGPAAHAAGVSDVCCWDLDGGGRGDDGVFTRSRGGQVVECAIVYDDVDRSRSLTPRDVVRSMPTSAGCRGDTPPPAPSHPPTTS